MLINDQRILYIIGVERHRGQELEIEHAIGWIGPTPRGGQNTPLDLSTSTHISCARNVLLMRENSSAAHFILLDTTWSIGNRRRKPHFSTTYMMPGRGRALQKEKEK